MKRAAVLLLLFPLLVFGCAATLLRYLWASISSQDRAWIIALGVDDLCNVASNGALGQSISSRAAHDRPQRWACLLCWLLNQLDPGHCDKAMTAVNQNLERNP